MCANKSDLFQNLSYLVIAAVVGLVAASVASEARSQTVILSGSPFPESLAATTDGTLFASSLTNGGIARVKPGASEAEAWIKPGTFDTRSTFGVLADETSGLLWVCSNDATPLGVKGPNTIEGSFVKGFDLKTEREKSAPNCRRGPRSVTISRLGRTARSTSRIPCSHRSSA